MSTPKKYVVKLARGGWSTILFWGTEASARARAVDLNDRYQTDEYFVERFDVNRLEGFGDVK
jgi:hypothetical protein